MQTAQIIPFKFDAREVRTLLIDDQPWFVAADVSLALEYRIAGDMTRNLDDDEKGTQIVRTPGGEQEMLVINESGLYSAILRSRKAEAKRFKKWITAEVLPTIRKHGSYADTHNKMGTLIGETIGTNGFNMLGALIKGKVVSLPCAVRRRATMKIWSQTRAAFNVRSAADIPAGQLDAARNFIAAYALEGEYMPKQDGIQLQPVPLRRYLVSFNHEGKQQASVIPPDACVMSRSEMLDAIVRPGELAVSTDEMYQFAMAALANLKMRLDNQSWQLKQMRKAPFPA